MGAATRVGLEIGSRWTFASALDWPGWCRRGRGSQEALDLLSAFAPRYALIAGSGFTPGALEVVGDVEGDVTTDFGAPGAAGPWDLEPVSPGEAGRLTALLESSWSAFDAVIAAAPSELRKGPRGGGRDRDQIAEHVREAERTYARKIGVRLPPSTPWPDQRAGVAEALRSAAGDRSWPTRYAVRRFAWHVTDHAWEIEDRSH